ncbi:MAG: shikimate dehydrogenase [Bacteroidaceae bacterium]|nr:shikimate dehydrogenase [Bacteroidaceae bacterium]
MTKPAHSNSNHSLPDREGGGRVFGLLGYPLGHSFSRAFFNNKFAEEGIDAEYLNFELPNIEQLPQVLADHPALRGFNVTIPYKQAVIPYLDALSDEARAIGAVNVVKVCPNPSLTPPVGGRTSEAKYLQAETRLSPPRGERGEGLYLKGYNSDIIGFMDSIRPLLQPHHRRALVLGTGGASKAICRGLEKLGLQWRYVSRTGAPAACPVLGDSVAEFPPLSYSALTPALLADYTVIVNCSPLGMYPKVDTCPAIPYEALTPRHLLYDLVYNPEETLFMKRGREHGATVKNGLEMLHLQALASWNFWTEESE